jgi:hypothetical protein
MLYSRYPALDLQMPARVTGVAVLVPSTESNKQALGTSASTSKCVNNTFVGHNDRLRARMF